MLESRYIDYVNSHFYNYGGEHMKKSIYPQTMIQRFPSAREFNKMVAKHDANCLAFIFGQTNSNLEAFDLLTMEQIQKLEHHQTLGNIDICKTFIAKALEFGYEVEQIDTLDEANNNVAFILFGWYSGYIESIGIYDYFFHVIRKNENGVFEHKSDWFSNAKKISPYRFNQLLNQTIPIHYFVLKRTIKTTR